MKETTLHIKKEIWLIRILVVSSFVSTIFFSLYGHWYFFPPVITIAFHLSWQILIILKTIMTRTAMRLVTRPYNKWPLYCREEPGSLA